MTERSKQWILKQVQNDKEIRNKIKTGGFEMERINMPYHVVRISAFCKKDFTAIIQSLETARQQVEPYWFNAKLMMMPTQTVGLSIYIQILATGVLGGDRLNTKALKKWKPVEVSIIRHRAIDVVMHGLRLGTHKQVSAI